MNETSFTTKVVIGAVIAVLIFIFVLSQGGHPGGLFVFAYSLLAFSVLRGGGRFLIGL